MLATIEHQGQTFRVDLSLPLDISLPLSAGAENVNAFYLPPVEIEPFRSGDFTGSIAAGGPCNVNNISFNPHGNGTHTESVGHISKEEYPVHHCLRQFFFLAELITIDPQNISGDRIIMSEQVKEKVGNKTPEALIIRTRPNGKEKMTKQYSGTNPAFLQDRAAEYIAAIGVKHLLLDVPSVDKEEDGGQLLAHHAFWKYPNDVRKESTITELIYVPDSIPDGTYLLNLQIASFMNDASPSKPILFKIIFS